MNEQPDAKFQFKANPTPQRMTLWGTFFTRKDTQESIPQPVEVTRQGEMKVRSIGQRIERLAGPVPLTAAGVLCYTAKCALTDVRIILVNVTAVESKYTLNFGINGAASATDNRMAFNYPVDKGFRDIHDELGMEYGDVIRASCTADNDFNLFVFGRRWIP